MKSLEEQMAFYAAYHQDVRNKATHFIGVPVIILSLFIPLAWPRIDVAGLPLTAAMLFAAIVLAYYLILDFYLGVAMAALTLALVSLGHQIAALGPRGRGSRRCSSAAGYCSSSGTPTKAGAPRSPTISSRSSSRRSSSARKSSSRWGINRPCTGQSRSARDACARTAGAEP